MRLIAGIDPGTTFGICLLDLKGNLVYTGSIKNAGKEKIIKEMTKHGKIIAIATDKVPTPDTVQKIGAMMNVKIFTPEQSMTQDYKTKITSDLPIKDLHQRDAGGAALWLYRKFENKFRHIESMKMTDEKKDEIKEKIIKGYTIKDVLAINKINKNKETKIGKRGKRKTEEYIKFLESEVKRIMNDNQSLRLEIKSLKSKINEIELENNKLRRSMRSELYKDKEIKKLMYKINHQKKIIKKLKNSIKNRRKKQSGPKKVFENKEKSGGTDLKNLLVKLIDEYRSSKQNRR
ncbi:DUF460 domain-containing protein [Candidatus Micrarchaeota archaeon]|nr:DUF460 domain-containing protein [Candidatus Micrarchaeota archaeon]